jgi:hypothetical protein
MDAVEARMKAGEEVTDCLAKTLVQTRDKENFDRLDMVILCSAFMIGGVETVRTAHRYDHHIARESHIRVSRQ